MGSFRFRKSIKIAPGIKINLNKKSTSVTVGKKGFHKTFSSNGKVTTSMGIPGTGLSYVDVENKKSSKNLQTDIFKNNFTGSDDVEMNRLNRKKLPLSMRTWFQFLMLFFISPVGIFLVWYHKEWKAPIKVIISIIFVLYFTFLCMIWASQ